MSGPFDPSPLDDHTLDETLIDTPVSAMTATVDENPRFQFSRELKILLGVLALGAAVAGWYVLSGAGTPADTAATATLPPSSTTPVQNGAGQPGAGQIATAPVAPLTPGTQVVPGVTAGTGSAAGSSVETGPAPSVTAGTGSGPVTAPVVPYLNPQGSQGQDLSGSGAGTPAGINPEDPLAAVPTSNPFQPLTVVNTNAPVGSAPLQANGNSGQGTANTAQTFNNGSGAGSSGGAAPVAGAVPLPSVPIAGVNSGGVNLNGNTGPVSSPAIRLGTGNNLGTGTNLGTSTSPGNSSVGVTSLGNGGAVPLPSIPLAGLPTTGSTAAGTNPSMAPVTVLPNAPVAPVQPAAGTITPGLRTPNLSSLPLGTLTAGASTQDTGALGTGAVGTGALGDSSTLTLNGVQPGLISQYGSANAPVVPEAPVVSMLDQLVQSRNLVFNAVVLGPINTAIFKTDQGFVVVPTGQTLPDSTVILKEVTATSVTLSLGNDSKILELDKR